MSALLLAVFLLAEPPPATPASPAPATSASPSPSPQPAKAKRDKSLVAASKAAPGPKKAPTAKVLTNDDLEKSREGGAAVSVLAVDGVEAPPMDLGSGGNSDGPGGGDVTERAPRNEANWRLRAQAARTRVSDGVARVAELEERMAALQSNLQPANAMSANYEQDRQARIQALTEEIAAARANLATQQKAMDDLEEQARREGVPPGWLREP